MGNDAHSGHTQGLYRQAKPPSPKQGGLGVRKRERRVAGGEWDREGERKGGLHDTQRTVCQGLSVPVHSTTNVSWLSSSLSLLFSPQACDSLTLSLSISYVLPVLSFYLFQLDEKVFVVTNLT